MTGRDLSSISARKYNTWCERRSLVCADEDRHRRARAFLARRNLAPSEQAAFYLHELTGCEGLEFVSFSNARLNNPVMLANDVVLVPCFLSESEMAGQNLQDMLVRLTMEMVRQNRFIYDGWIPIETWDEGNVRKAVRSVDEALSLFSLKARAYFEWKPKYPAPDESQSIYTYEDQHLQELERVAKLLDSLGEGDRVAIYRSLAWLSQGLHLNEPAARFLFSILAIESLATYIEEEAPYDSPLAVLRAERLTRTERRTKREKCIDDTLLKWLQRDSTEAVKKAYFDCVVGLERRLQTHLEHVFTSDPEPITLLFGYKVAGKSLYDLRHVIAHGTVDALSEAERDQIRQRVWDAERVARKYISAVVNTALGAKPFSKTMTATIFIGVENVVVPSEGMYQGPIHMADVYSYNLGSAIRFGKRGGVR